VQQTGQELGRELCGNFQIFDRFCSQNLQMSADCFNCWGTLSSNPYWSFNPEPHWKTFVPQTPFRPQMKIPGAATDQENFTVTTKLKTKTTEFAFKSKT